nr:transposase [Collimonas fungivorans]
MRDLLAQRIYGLRCGWEGVCDHNVLRRELALQTVVPHRRTDVGATLSGLERAPTPAHTAVLCNMLLDQFTAGNSPAPTELILDVDTTHVPLNGAKEKVHFHSYYDNYCYLPLYTFYGQNLLACVLRPSSSDLANMLGALNKLPVQRLRKGPAGIATLL